MFGLSCSWNIGSVSRETSWPRGRDGTDSCIAGDLTFSVWGQTKLNSLWDLRPWDPHPTKRKIVWAHWFFPGLKKHVGKKSQFPTRQMHHPRCPVKVPIPLWETLRKLLQIFLCISSLSDWTLHFRELWQSIKLKKTGEWAPLAEWIPIMETLFKMIHPYCIYWLMLDFCYISELNWSKCTTHF